jgi:hypothetical protein
LIAVGLIEQLNLDMKGAVLPLGIGIDFRFKHSLFESLVSTVEFPEDDTASPFFDFSYILKQDDFRKLPLPDETEQVAWHPGSSKFLGLKAEEKSVLNELRILLFKCESEDERKTMINEIKYY